MDHGVRAKAQEVEGFEGGSGSEEDGNSCILTLQSRDRVMAFKQLERKWTDEYKSKKKSYNRVSRSELFCPVCPW